MANLNVFIQQLPELVQIALGLQSQLWQIDGGKGEITTAASFARAVDIANNSGTTAHGSYIGIVIARLIVLQVIWRIYIDKIREQSLGAYSAGLLEKIVVRIVWVVIDSGFELEYRNRENSGFTVAQTGLNSIQYLSNSQSALRTGVHTIVNGAERNLGTGPAMESVEVVNQGFHSLMGFLSGIGTGQMIDVYRILSQIPYRSLSQLLWLGGLQSVKNHFYSL